MITTSDSLNTLDLGSYYAILPSAGEHSPERYLELRPGKHVPVGFAYNSGTNEQFLTPAELRALIRQHVDPSLLA
jgi:hypothetical protein